MPPLDPLRDTPSWPRHLTDDLLEARRTAAIFRDARAVVLTLDLDLDLWVDRTATTRNH